MQPRRHSADWHAARSVKELQMNEPMAGGRYLGQQPTRRAVLGAVAGLGLAGVAGLPRTPARRIGPRAAAALSNLQLAGQRVISSYPGLTPPQSLFSDITAGQTAGVIFFGGNISSDTQIAGVITQLRQAQAQSPIGVPLLLMTDQEGGEVRRLPAGAGSPAQSDHMRTRAQILSASPDRGTRAEAGSSGIHELIRRL